MEDLTDLLLPARVLVPDLPDEFFTATVDGAYARSIIVDELTFAQQIWAVRPLNGTWLGPLPSSLPEVLDLQNELWMNESHRQQVRAIRLIGRLGDAGRTELTKDDEKNRDYHPVDLQEVELQRQRGFWTYFVEDLDVFDAARALSYARLSEQYPRQP